MLQTILSHTAAVLTLLSAWAAVVWLFSGWWFLASDGKDAAIRLMRYSVTALIVFGSGSAVIGTAALVGDLMAR